MYICACTHASLDHRVRLCNHLVFWVLFNDSLLAPSQCVCSNILEFDVLLLLPSFVMPLSLAVLFQGGGGGSVVFVPAVPCHRFHFFFPPQSPPTMANMRRGHFSGGFHIFKYSCVLCLPNSLQGLSVSSMAFQGHSGPSRPFGAFQCFPALSNAFQGLAVSAQAFRSPPKPSGNLECPCSAVMESGRACLAQGRNLEGASMPMLFLPFVPPPSLQSIEGSASLLPHSGTRRHSHLYTQQR